MITTRKKWAGRATALTALTATATLALGGLSYADTLQDTIADTGTGVTLVAGSSTSGSAGIRVVGNNAAGDPDPGCNIDAGENPLKLTIHTPTGVSANPNPLSITSCGTDFGVSFTAAANAQSGHATVTVLSGPAGGGTYENKVDIPITITQPQPTNTAPQVSVTGVQDGQTYRKSSVPTPGCSVVDDEDSGESATPQVSNGAYDALGSHTVTCSYTDGGGITRSASASYTVIRDADTTAPVIGYTLNPASPDGANGWYTGNVTLSWTVTENESAETLKKTGCVDQTISADQALTAYTCSASSEGGTAQESVSIKRDGTAPAVSYDSVVSGTAGLNGWYTSDVTVKFTATDALSGPATQSDNVTTSGQGTAVTVSSPAFSDEAGNTRAAGAATSPAFKIDKQAPNAPSYSIDPAPNGAGWNNTDVVVSFSDNGDNGPSGVDSCTPDVPVNMETAGHDVVGTCTDKAGNVSATTKVTVQIDKTAPTVNYTSATGTLGANGWYTSDVTAKFTATDALSGVNGSASQTVLSSGEGANVVVESPEFSDNAGNTTAVGAASHGFKIDKTAPTNITFTGGPAAGSSYYFGSVPSEPTCSASDALSGFDRCDVSGYSTAVGTHTMTATAKDMAGNTATATRTYTVLAWTTRGFYQPVDMSTATTTVWNTVKGGSTVPLKFELFAGSTELTDISAVSSFQTAKVTCDGAGTDMADPIEIVTTGGTSLRYDSTGGQFIQNWKTPTALGCYRATMTADDGSSITAFFKILK